MPVAKASATTDEGHGDLRCYDREVSQRDGVGLDDRARVPVRSQSAAHPIGTSSYPTFPTTKMASEVQLCPTSRH
jgi:hypothetical protein